MSTENILRIKDLMAAKIIHALQSCKTENGFSQLHEEQHTSICYVDGLWALADNYNGAELVIVHEAPADHAVLSDISTFQLNELMRYEKTIAQLITLGRLQKENIVRGRLPQAKPSRPQHQNSAPAAGNRQLGKPIPEVRF